MLVKLTAKLAEMVNGLDLSHCDEGDIIELAEGDARMLILEGWAEAVSPAETISCAPKRVERAVASDNGFRGWRKAPPPGAGPQRNREHTRSRR